MIRLEDAEFENEILSGDSCIAVPIEITQKTGGALEILTYSFCKDIAEEFEKKFSRDPFSEEAQKFLADRLTPKMSQLEYSTESACTHGYYVYCCEAPDRAKILPDCEIIDTLDGEKWDELELDEFMLDSEEPTDRMAVIRREGKIVCYAGLNDLSEEDGLYELTVECAEDFRRNGYAASCTAKLTEYLISIGEGVKYICSVDHTASQKTAEAAGFSVNRRVLPFVCYRNDGDEEEITD